MIPSNPLSRDDLYLRGWDLDRERRFWDKIDCGGECWIYKQPRGRYGYFGIGGRKTARMNRVSFALYNGPIPEGAEVCHTCDNDKCVRPEHLFLGTRDINMNDMASKNRSADKKGTLNGRARLRPVDVLQILKLAETHSKAEIGRLYGVTDVTIHGICTGRLWAHVTGIQRKAAAA